MSLPERLLTAYRAKRSVDGLNGRTWDAVRHAEAETDIELLEDLVGDTIAVVHDELYSNASVSLEFAVDDLTSRRHHTQRTVGLVKEAQQSIWRAIAALRTAPSSHCAEAASRTIIDASAQQSSTNRADRIDAFVRGFLYPSHLCDCNIGNDPFMAAERTFGRTPEALRETEGRLASMHASVLRAICELEANNQDGRSEWVGNVRQMLNDAHCAAFPIAAPSRTPTDHD